MSYIIEYAKSGRSRCRGPIALCHSSNHTISKDELRLGVEVENIKGVSWKHWTCVSPEVLSNMKESLSTPDIMKGWENLKEEDKEKIKEAWELGDIPNRPQPANKSPRRGKRKSSADADEIKSDEIKSDESNLPDRGTKNRKKSQPKKDQKGSRRSSRIKTLV